MEPPTLEQAISLYIDEMGHAYAPEYVKVRAAALARLHAFSKVRLLHELQPYDLKAFASSFTKGYSQHVKAFVRWSNERFGWPPYTAPVKLKLKFRQMPPHISMKAIKDALRWRTTLEFCAPLMKLPHQRAVFLMGYMYGLSLTDLSRLTAEDLKVYHPLRIDLYDLLDTLNYTMPLPLHEPIFGHWLGANRFTAGHKWTSWVGRGHPFTHIVMAGDVDLIQAGCRPRHLGRRKTAALIGGRPNFSVEGAERMGWFWGEGQTC